MNDRFLVSFHLVRALRNAAFGVALVFAATATVHAERFPLSPGALVDESDLIVVGRIVDLRVGTERSHIEQRFGNYDWAIDLTLRVQRIEKGDYRADTIVARCFRIKTRNALIGYVSVSGNHPIPDVGTEVRAHLYRRGELWRVVFPNGLAPVSERLTLSDAPAVRSLSSRRFTFGFPGEVWICIALVYLLLRVATASVRRLRRSRASQVDRDLVSGKAP